MSPHVRQGRIIELLEIHDECSVEFLVARLGVSGMTIRRDLKTLAEAGRIIRTHGGATLAGRVSFEFQFLNRSRQQQEAKQAIAEVAANLIEDGQSVMLDSSTTTLALAARFKTKKSLTVITTSLPIASELQYCDHVDVLLLGGVLRQGAPDLAGALTETNLENIRADVAFIGGDAVDRDGNIYNASLDVGRMLSKMAASAERVYAVVDSSKLGQKALSRFGNITQWEGLITDRGLNQPTALALKRAGVRVTKAPVRKGR